MASASGGLPHFASLVAGQAIQGDTRTVINPATGDAFATFTAIDVPMLEAAVAAAVDAQPRWATTALDRRRALLVELADIVRDHAADLARLLTLEQGKPLAEAQVEIGAAEAIFRHYAAMGDDSALFDQRTARDHRVYTPLGVVAGIVPWNFPFLIAVMKTAPALLAGNTIVVKPAPTTPVTTLAFARLCADAVPFGVFQVVGDAGEIGPRLAAHPAIAKISFTGSTATGRKVMRAAADTLKRLTLELGGNDPALVLGDADPSAAADGIFGAAFANCGQICGAVKRVYVHRSRYDAFCAAMVERLGRLVVGDGLEQGVTTGPLQNRIQFDKARNLLADARAHGRILASAPAPAGPGYFIAPTLVADVADDHPLVADEQFAPLLPILAFDDEEEAIARANATPYGLTASVWSADATQAEAVAARIDASLVGINQHNQAGFDRGLSMAKQSGIGWLMGEEGLKEYLQPHLIAW